MLVDSKTGKEMTFVEVVVSLLISENDKSEEEAALLVKSYPQVILSGMLAGWGQHYRATAMALLMMEEDIGVLE